jgi:hypothetical protein
LSGFWPIEEATSTSGFRPAAIHVGLLHEICRNAPLRDPEAAARKLTEIANSVELLQDGRIHTQKINWPFLSEFKCSPVEYSVGLKLAIERGWLWLYESGTYVKLAPAVCLMLI